jgi:hypothetical protein
MPIPLDDVLIGYPKAQDELRKIRARVAGLEAALGSADQWAADHSEFVDPVYVAKLEWGLQWMLNNLTGINHEWAKEACSIARQSLNP